MKGVLFKVFYFLEMSYYFETGWLYGRGIKSDDIFHFRAT